MKGKHDIREDKIRKGGDWLMKVVGMYIWLFMGLRWMDWLPKPKPLDGAANSRAVMSPLGGSCIVREAIGQLLDLQAIGFLGWM